MNIYIYIFDVYDKYIHAASFNIRIFTRKNWDGQARRTGSCTKLYRGHIFKQNLETTCKSPVHAWVYHSLSMFHSVFLWSFSCSKNWGSLMFGVLRYEGILWSASIDWAPEQQERLMKKRPRKVTLSRRWPWVMVQSIYRCHSMSM